MSERRQLAILAGLSGGTLTCFGWLLFCPHREQCLTAMTHLDTWASAGTKIALPLAGASLAAWLMRTFWLLLRAGVRIAALPTTEVPPSALLSAMKRTGVGGVKCIDADAPTAFCAGALRPRVLVSEGLFWRLGADELDVVLLHEREHVRTFEPLVRAAHDSASEVLFYVPLVRWWSRRRLEDSELRADRIALERLGPRQVAAALWAMGGSTAVRGAAAFGGVAELRVAQLLGDPSPPERPDCRWSRYRAWAPTWPFRLPRAWCRQLSASANWADPNGLQMDRGRATIASSCY